MAASSSQWANWAGSVERIQVDWRDSDDDMIPTTCEDRAAVRTDLFMVATDETPPMDDEEVDADVLADAYISTRADAREAIETWAENFTTMIERNRVYPTLELMSCTHAHGRVEDVEGGGSVWRLAENGKRLLDFYHSTQQLPYLRFVKIMEVTHQLLLASKVVTQRELYYHLKPMRGGLFATPGLLNATIRDVCMFLRCTRSSLAITCTAKGAVAGALRIKQDDNEWVDCSTLNASGFAIPGDPEYIQTRLSGLYYERVRGALLVHMGMIDNSMQVDARDAYGREAQYIIVIEKDAVFQRLSADRIFDGLPCVLLTAKGFPDLASRVFLHTLHRAAPNAVVLAIVDYNAAGVMIMNVFKHGSLNMGLEGHQFAVPALKWLGVRMADLFVNNDLSRRCLQPFTARDHTLLNTLLNSRIVQEGAGPAIIRELQAMKEEGRKMEIEGLYTVSGIGGELVDFIVHKILRRDFI